MQHARRFAPHLERVRELPPLTDGNLQQASSSTSTAKEITIKEETGGKVEERSEKRRMEGGEYK